MDQVIIQTKLSHAPTYVVSSESELMKNHQAAFPVSPDQQVSAVYDGQNQPLVFSFSPDQHFYVIHHATKHPTGWDQVDLNPSLQKLGAPKSFSVLQLQNGNIFVALAIQEAADPATESLFIAGPLSPDLSQTDWTQLGTYLVRAGNPHKGTTINRVFISPISDDQGFDLPFLAVSLKDGQQSDISNYILKSNVDAASGKIEWNWQDFPTPTQKSTPIDYALGAIEDLGQGVYMLYEGEGGETFLVFKTLPNDQGRSFDRQFTAPPQASALQTASGQRATTSLFVGGGKGLFWYSASNQDLDAQPEQIAEHDALSTIRQNGLIVRQDDLENGGISIWILSGESIYYIHNQLQEAEKKGWSSPILFHKEASLFAP
jgi:hypothetical protein